MPGIRLGTHSIRTWTLLPCICRLVKRQILLSNLMNKYKMAAVISCAQKDPGNLMEWSCLRYASEKKSATWATNEGWLFINMWWGTTALSWLRETPVQRPVLLEAATRKVRAQQVRRKLIKGEFPLHMKKKSWPYKSMEKSWRNV